MPGTVIEERTEAALQVKLAAIDLVQVLEQSQRQLAILRDYGIEVLENLLRRNRTERIKHVRTSSGIA